MVVTEVGGGRRPALCFVMPVEASLDEVTGEGVYMVDAQSIRVAGLPRVGLQRSRYRGEEAGQADHAELVGGDKGLDLADERDKHAGPWNRMCKLCVLYTIKLSKGGPDLHSLRAKLSSDLLLAEEDVSFNHNLVQGPSQDHLI